MRYYSTNHKSAEASFEEALLRGLAPDGGLYLPVTIPSIKNQVSRIKNFPKITLTIAQQFIDIPEGELKKIIDDAFDPDAFPVGAGFPAPLVKLDEHLYVLELFHGPTLSFKDFGARFMARVMGYYIRIKNKESRIKRRLNIIVATSGDTGSAVASAFFGLPHINVFVLYPSGRVSLLQEKQIATFGKNVFALEVKGDFDDCQRLAKQALADEELREKMMLSSANSINIGRLIPQSFYYAWAAIQMNQESRIKNQELTFVVPSGNFGNLTGAIIAKKMGFPLEEIIAAVNENYGKEKAVQTLSSAMDVARPSNWARVKELNAENIPVIQVSEEETRVAIRDTYQKYGYIADPHTAVGLAAAEKYESRIKNQARMAVVSTAHPAKFPEIIEKEIGRKIEMPPQLRAVMNKEKRSVVIPADYGALKKALLEKGL